MKLAIRKIFSLILVIIFFIETTPDGLLHLLANHEDTHDIHSNEIIVGEKHIHCHGLHNFFPAFSLNELASLPEIPFIVVPQRFYSTSVHTFPFLSFNAIGFTNAPVLSRSPSAKPGLKLYMLK